MTTSDLPQLPPREATPTRARWRGWRGGGQPGMSGAAVLAGAGGAAGARAGLVRVYCPASIQSDRRGQRAVPDDHGAARGCGGARGWCGRGGHCGPGLGGRCWRWGRGLGQSDAVASFVRAPAGGFCRAGRAGCGRDEHTRAAAAGSGQARPRRRSSRRTRARWRGCGRRVRDAGALGRTTTADSGSPASTRSGLAGRRGSGPSHVVCTADAAIHQHSGNSGHGDRRDGRRADRADCGPCWGQRARGPSTPPRLAVYVHVRPPTAARARFGPVATCHGRSWTRSRPCSRKRAGRRIAVSSDLRSPQRRGERRGPQRRAQEEPTEAVRPVPLEPEAR